MSTSTKNKSNNEAELLQASRNASAYFERFDKSGLHDAASRRSTHWLLSEEAVAAASNTSDYLQPLIRGLQAPLEEDKGYILLIPWPQSLVGSKPLYLQDLHQITRELVEGIFVFNQTPSLSMEGNADGTTSCYVPSAFLDTLVGDTMLSVDYYMKSLLHGTTINGKDKRSKILEEWKRFSPAKLRNRFEELGLTDIIADDELGSNVYVEEQSPFIRYPPLFLDRNLAQAQLQKRFSTSEDHGHYLDHMGRDMFLRYLDHVNIDLIFRQKSVQQHGAFLILEPSYDVTTSVKATLKESDPSLYAHLHTYLQKQRDFILRHLETKRHISYQLQLLSFVSFLLPFLISLKKQNKVVDVSQFLPRLSKEILRTDRDLPPTLPSKDSRWSPYTAENTHCSLHGGIHFHTLPLTVVPPSLSPAKLASLEGGLCSTEEELTSCELGNTKYYGFNVSLERFYLQTPKQPRWVHAMMTELRSQAARQPAITEARVLDNLRKLLGPRQIAAVKNVNTLLQLSVEKGLLSAVSALLKRCTQTRLNKTDEAGMSLLHYAAVNGRCDVISALVLSGCQVEQAVGEPCTYPKDTQPIHLASQSGGLAAVCCLQHYGADLGAKDDRGWSAIHYAAFHNYQAIISHLISVDKTFLDLPTSDRDQSTPLLLAAQNGCFDSFQRLIDLGATLEVMNGSNLTPVHLIILRHQFQLLKYLVKLKSKNIHGLIWKVFAEMLGSDSLEHARAAARILDALTRKVPEQVEPVIEYKIIPLLVKLLKKEDDLPLMAIQVLSNLSNLTIVKSTLLAVDAIPCIVKLLSSSSERSQSCACVVLSDLGVSNADNRVAIAKAGALSPLVKLLSSSQDDVRTYACACVGVLCTDSASNQNTVAELSATPTLISLLASLRSCILGCTANTIQCLVKGNHANQLLLLSKGALPPLVALLRSQDPSVHNSAAKAIEAIAENCKRAQTQLMEHPHCVELLKRLLKMRDPAIKVCGGCTLWAIAGELISHKRYIAAQIGLDLLVDMLTVNNQRLNYVCSEALGALASELGDNQVQILRVGGVKPLLDVLSSAVTERVCLSIIHTLAALCMKPALVPNTVTQKKIGSSRGVSHLAAIVASKQVTDIVRVEAACALAKLVLKNKENDRLLSQHKEFSYLTVFKFLSSSDSFVRLLGGYCLSVMAFNNPKKIKQLQAIGSLHYSNFVPFLESKEEFQVHAAFQVVVLSKLLVGIRSVDIAVKGLRLLTNLLTSEMESIKVQSAEFIASLAHTGNGIPDTLVMTGALEKLMLNLASGTGPVVESCSVALGYFTFNPTASRLIIGMFRDSPELFGKFRPHLSTIVVSKKFLANWSYLTDIGLPTLSLTVRGGPSIATGRRQTVTAPGNELPAVSRPESKESTITFGHDRKTHKQLKCDKTFNVGFLVTRKNSLPLNPGNKQLVAKQHPRRQTVPATLTLSTTKNVDIRTLAL